MSVLPVPVMLFIYHCTDLSCVSSSDGDGGSAGHALALGDPAGVGYAHLSAGACAARLAVVAAGAARARLPGLPGRLSGGLSELSAHRSGPVQQRHRVPALQLHTDHTVSRDIRELHWL